jgi:hypothetical protein
VKNAWENKNSAAARSFLALAMYHFCIPQETIHERPFLPCSVFISAGIFQHGSAGPGRGKSSAGTQ